MTHFQIGDILMRTPLGGFLNHSEINDPIIRTPLGGKLIMRMKRILKEPDYMFNKWNLITLQDIKEGEELTLKYTFYKI